MHALIGLVAVVAVHHGGTIAPATPQEVSRMPPFVMLAVPGPSGGGGGGGEHTTQPARRAELRGADERTVPVAGSRESYVDRPAPEQPLQIDAQSLASGSTALAGSIVGDPGLPTRGPGEGPGANGGRGRGDSDGVGPGVGPGQDGGCCEGAYRPGNDVEEPIPIREVKPAYTTDAVRARLQGSVWVEAVVLPDGSVGRVRVIRSLDRQFGLDEEALKAARQWRFKPGTRLGKPVAVVVVIELAFMLH